MPKIAVLGGTGYLASIIKNQNNLKKNNYIFFSRKKKSTNYIDYSNFEKNTKLLKNFDVIIFLAGPNKNQIKNENNLINAKKYIVSKICDFCKIYKIRLIYISSLHVYKNYGFGNIVLSSKINFNNLYAKSHYETEKIIIKKFENNKNIFTILRLGNVFGFNNIIGFNKFYSNIIHQFCYSALKKKYILINNASIQRSFIPSEVFIKNINEVIKKQKYNNSIINISYKVYNLKDISRIIKKRVKIIFNKNVEIKFNKFINHKKSSIYVNYDYRQKFRIKIIYDEIDRILKLLNKNKIYF